MEQTIGRVLVVGAGAMGTQVAATFAKAWVRVSVVDIDQATLDRSRAEAAARLRGLGERGVIDDPESVISRLAWTTDLEGAAQSADFVVEAAAERTGEKRALFELLGALTPPHAILTAASSTVPSSLFADASARPDRVCSLHFFHPALVTRCVEVVPNPRTSSATIDAVVALAERIGKVVVRLEKEVPGFVANRLLGAIQDEATRLYADGVASLADIDRAATLALGHPMGPFELMDLVGLDTIQLRHAAEAEMTGDPARAAHPALARLVDDGALGRKSGRGWYDYT